MHGSRGMLALVGLSRDDRPVPQNAGQPRFEVNHYLSTAATIAKQTNRMKHITRGVIASLMMIGLGSLTTNVQAQCETWVNPSATTGWTDFNTAFGGAPCDDGSGCPFNEIDGFQVWADEAYLMDNVQAGGEYTFSACNGVGGTAWPLTFTIIAPSNAVDAFGLDAGSTCALTWTASETGTYRIVVSEQGFCGNSSNQATDNGFPAITCNGVSCAPPQPGCTTWLTPSPTTGYSDFNTAFGGAPVAEAGVCPVNEITDFEVWADEAYSMNNAVAGTIYQFSACNGVGGTAWTLYFTVIAPSGTVDAFGLDNGSSCALTWTASESGNYIIVVSEDGACGTSANTNTDNGFPAMTCLGTVGISSIDAQGGAFSVFPNPTNGAFTIDLNQVRIGDRDVLEVFDISGRRVYNEQLRAGETIKQIDLSAQPVGAYFITIQQDQRVLREKLVIVRD